MAHIHNQHEAHLRFLYCLAGFVLATQFFTIIFVLLPAMGVI